MLFGSYQLQSSLFQSYNQFYQLFTLESEKIALIHPVVTIFLIPLRLKTTQKKNKTQKLF